MSHECHLSAITRSGKSLIRMNQNSTRSKNRAHGKPKRSPNLIYVYIYMYVLTVVRRHFNVSEYDAYIVPCTERTYQTSKETLHARSKVMVTRCQNLDDRYGLNQMFFTVQLRDTINDKIRNEGTNEPRTRNSCSHMPTYKLSSSPADIEKRYAVRARGTRGATPNAT